MREQGIELWRFRIVLKYETCMRSQPTRKSLLAAGFVAALFTVACNQTPAPDPKAQEAAQAQAKAADVAALKALEDKFTAAFNAKDINAVMSAYVPDSSLLVFDATPPRQWVGADGYRKDWEGLFAAFTGQIEFALTDADYTVGGGDVAFGHSIQHVKGTLKEGNKKMDFTVRVTDGYKKVNGQWLIAHEHVSFPVDLMTGKADMDSKP